MAKIHNMFSIILPLAAIITAGTNLAQGVVWRQTSAVGLPDGKLIDEFDVEHHADGFSQFFEPREFLI